MTPHAGRGSGAPVRPGGWTAAWAGVFAALAASGSAVVVAVCALAPAFAAWIEAGAEAVALERDVPDDALVSRLQVLLEWGLRAAASVLPCSVACATLAASALVAALLAVRGGRRADIALRSGLAGLAVASGVCYLALRADLLQRWDADAAAARDALAAIWRTGSGESLPDGAARWLSRGAGEAYLAVPLGALALGALALAALQSRPAVRAWREMPR